MCNWDNWDNWERFYHWATSGVSDGLGTPGDPDKLVGVNYAHQMFFLALRGPIDPEVARKIYRFFFPEGDLVLDNSTKTKRVEED